MNPTVIKTSVLVLKTKKFILIPYKPEPTECKLNRNYFISPPPTPVTPFTAFNSL